MKEVCHSKGGGGGGRRHYYNMTVLSISGGWGGGHAGSNCLVVEVAKGANFDCF